MSGINTIMTRTIRVKEHTRSNGTKVAAHTRVISSDNTKHTSVPGISFGLDSLAEEAQVVPDGWEVVAGEAFPVAGLYGSASEYPSLTHIDLSGKELRGVDFSGLHIVGVNFTGADLEGAKFRGADMESAIFKDAVLRDADFSQAEGNFVVFDGADLSGVNFSGAQLSHLSGEGATMVGKPPLLENATLEFSRLTRIPGSHEAEMSETRLGGIDWSDTDLTAVKMSDIYSLVGSSLKNSDMSGVECFSTSFIATNFENTKADGAIFAGSVFVHVEGEGASFKNAYFDRTSFSESAFPNASFREAQMRTIEAVENTFDGSDFSSSSITYSNLSFNTFTGADFTGADLSFVDFATPENEEHEAYGDIEAAINGVVEVECADLEGVIWKEAVLDKTTFATNIKVSTGVSHEPRGDDYVTYKYKARYDSFTVEQAAEVIGVSPEEIGVLVWGGLLEGRNAITGEVAEGDFSLAETRIPSWALQNWQT